MREAGQTYSIQESAIHTTRLLANTMLIVFAFYLAIKYQLKLNTKPKWKEELVELNDCISILLGWKYAKKNKECIIVFQKNFNKLKDQRGQDKFWLFIYDFAKKESAIPEKQEFSRGLKKKKMSVLFYR